MSLRTRSLVFATFFGSCLAIGLLLISLTTNHWVRASALRANSSESRGHINYGLFGGTKDLNIGNGPRPQIINVYTLIQTETDMMNFWLWFLTSLGTGLGLLSSAIAAIASVFKAASAAKKRRTMFLLFASNISSASAQITAFICWLIQFYQYLLHNVLTTEDRRSHWYSDGLASLGFSFYLIIASIMVVFLNLVILYYAQRSEYKEGRRFEPPMEEKNQSAIMLY